MTRNGWFTQSQRGITFRDAGGGAWHAILGTLEQVFAVLADLGADRRRWSASTSSSTAAARWPGRRRSWSTSSPVCRRSSRRCSSTPSFITTFHGQRGGWLVSLALVLLMIPVIVRTTEEMLKLVPNELREASYALGVPKWKTIAAHRGADRADRHHHRHRARHRPRGRRDGAAADPGRLHPEHQRQPVQRASRARCPA